jgi:multiple sugar transport system substrate-binding protein
MAIHTPRTPGPASPGGLQISRRSFLRASAVGAGALTLGGCGTLGAGITGAPVAPGTVTFWDLFGGGDGVRMADMLTKFQQQHSELGFQHVTLSWGNPYYTKLSLATLGDQPPDVGVSHASRLSTFVGSNLLQELTPDVLAKHGLTPDKFSQKAMQAVMFNGKQYAVPLDTHPFVLFYNTDICKKAGLLDASGNLKSVDGPTAFVDALTAAQKTGVQWGGVCAVTSETSTNWRIFQSLYAQLGGQMLADNGTKVVVDEAKALQVLNYLRDLTVTKKLMPTDVDYPGAIALFASGKAGFYLQGEWEISTFQTAKMPFGMTLFPNVFGGDKYAVQADSHTLVVPTRGNDPTRTDHALTFIRSLLDQSLTWAQGGHIPAWLPVADSAEYKKLKPQSNYAAAAAGTVYDPSAWYSGSGSNFEIVTGSAIATVRSGQAGPQEALSGMISNLQTYAKTPSPV